MVFAARRGCGRTGRIARRTALLQLLLCAAFRTLRSGDACVQVTAHLGAILLALRAPSASA